MNALCTTTPGLPHAHRHSHPSAHLAHRAQPHCHTPADPNLPHRPLPEPRVTCSSTFTSPRGNPRANDHVCTDAPRIYIYIYLSLSIYIYIYIYIRAAHSRLCCFYFFGQKLFCWSKTCFVLLLLIVISTICLFSVENIYFCSKTPQRVRGEYSRVRAYPGKAVFAQKTVQGEWIALFMQHLSASTRRACASKGLTPKNVFVVCFCFVVRLVFVNWFCSFVV